MKITIYELLGMIKEGTAPKKIKNDSIVYIYNEIREDYYDKVNDKYFINMFFNRFKTRFFLVRKIEIIEEPQEHKIPEKLEICYSPDIEEEIFYEKGNKPNHYVLGDKGNKLIISKINEILDYLEVK